MKRTALSLLMISTLALGACDTMNGMGPKQGLGTAAGAVAGGLAGSQIGGGSGRLWATGAGALLGAFVGSEIGSSLDKADLAYAEQASSRAHSAPLGETITWENPQSGNHGTITPVKQGRSSSGEMCREYQQTIVVEGRSETAYGQACQQSDGTWRLVN